MSSSYLYLLLFTLITLLRAQSEDNAEFLFQNAKICGDPFADPMWIPTLDICKLDCDKATEYCVENEELKQQCKKMPEECIQLLHEKQMVDKFFDD